MSAAQEQVEEAVASGSYSMPSDAEVMSFQVTLPDSVLPARIHMERVWNDEELIRFSERNPLIRFEQEPDGDLSIMSPVGSQGSEHETDIVLELGIWAREDGRGRAYSSNGGFRLPDGSMRAADAAWVSWEKIRAVPQDQVKGYYPLCPECVVEVRSENDSLTKLREKMEQWIANGCELAWLVDPSRKTVEIYRPNQAPETQEGQSAVYGEGPVAGFVLELGRIWS